MKNIVDPDFCFRDPVMFLETSIQITAVETPEPDVLQNVKKLIFSLGRIIFL